MLKGNPCYVLVSGLQKILISTTGGSGAYSEVRLRRRILNDFWVGHSERLPPPSTFLERNHLFSFLSLVFLENLQGGILGRGAFKCAQVSSPALPLTTPLSKIVALVSGLQFLSYPLLRITRLYNYSGSIIPSCSCVWESLCPFAQVCPSGIVSCWPVPKKNSPKQILLIANSWIRIYALDAIKLIFLHKCVLIYTAYLWVYNSLNAWKPYQ